ncbi:MAG TPA: hypothetical protein VGH19_16095 [Verrucomicrobiae bacterium]
MAVEIPERVAEEIGWRNRPFARVEGLYLPQTSLNIAPQGQGGGGLPVWVVVVAVVFLVYYFKR